MTEHTFNNEHNVILCSVSILLDRFERENQLFAAQCTWWLASIIQFTEVLIYYRHYEIFPSDYIKNLVVTPLLDWLPSEEMNSESNIAQLNFATVIITPAKGSYIEHPSRKKYLPKELNNNLSIDRTRSGKVFKPERLKQKDLRKGYPGFSNKQLAEGRKSLQKDGLII